MRPVSLLNITELDSANINDDLNISIQNMRGKKPHLFYISDDVNSNQLLLTITNNTEKEFVIKSGAPIAEDSSSVTKLGYSAFWLLFENFLSDADIKQLSLDDQSKDNWQTMLFENKNSGTDFSPSYICITAKHDITLKNGDSEKIVFTPFKIGDNLNGNGMGTLQVDYFVPSVYTMPKFVRFPVQISQTPASSKDDSPFTFTVYDSKPSKLPNTIDISLKKEYEISNTLTLGVVNQSEKALTFSSSEKANLRIAVIKGENRSALTDNIVNMECKTENNGIVVLPATTFDGWDISKVATVGLNDTIYFEMNNIVTYLEEGITLIYLTYSNINGYNDGYTVLPLRKKIPSATISKFDVKVIPAEKDHTSLNSQQQCANWEDSVTLSFIVCEVDSVELFATYHYYKGSSRAKLQASNTLTTIEKENLYLHQLTNKAPFEFTQSIKDIVPTDYSNIFALEFGIRAYKDNRSIPEVTVPKLTINSAKINSSSHKIVPVWDTQNPPNLSGSLTLTWDIEGVDNCQLSLPEGCSSDENKHGETVTLPKKDILKDIKVSNPYKYPSFKIEGLRNNAVVISQIINIDKNEVMPDGKINSLDGHIDINIPHGPSAYGTVNYHTTGVKTCYLAAIDLEGTQQKEVIKVAGVNGYVEINSDNFFYDTKGMKFTLLCIANNGWPIQQEATVMYTDHQGRNP